MSITENKALVSRYYREIVEFWEQFDLFGLFMQIGSLPQTNRETKF